MSANICRYNEKEATLLASTVLSNKFTADRYLALLPRPEYQECFAVIQTSRKQTKARSHALATVVEAAVLHVHDVKAVDDLIEWLITEAACSKVKSEQVLVKQATPRAQQQKKAKQQENWTRASIERFRKRRTENAEGAGYTKKKKKKKKTKTSMKPLFEWLVAKIRMDKPNAGKKGAPLVEVPPAAMTPTKLPPLTEDRSISHLMELGGLIRVSQRGPKHSAEFHAEAHLGAVSAYAVDTTKKKAKRSAAMKCLQETTDIDYGQRLAHRELRGCVKKVMDMGGIVRVEQKGPDHALVFRANAHLGDISVCATASTKKMAKRTAAWKCLQELQLLSA